MNEHVKNKSEDACIDVYAAMHGRSAPQGPKDAGCAPGQAWGTTSRRTYAHQELFHARDRDRNGSSTSMVQRLTTPAMGSLRRRTWANNPLGSGKGRRVSRTRGDAKTYEDQTATTNERLMLRERQSENFLLYHSTSTSSRELQDENDQENDRRLTRMRGMREMGQRGS